MTFEKFFFGTFIYTGESLYTGEAGMMVRWVADCGG
jgi:hypothetical protein